MKSDRLLSILLLLQTRDRVSADELAARLEVSARTIYRDIEALSSAGVPVYAERGRNGGIALLPGFRTDVTGLTSDEARALFVLAAEGAHSALGLQGALGSALRKVMAALPAPHRPAAELTSRRILVDPGRWMTGPRASGDLDVLHTGVFADRRLRLSYRHSGDRRTHCYVVDPYGLVSKAGVWYLVADHRQRAALFRADRIEAAAVTDAPVKRRPGAELADVWETLRRRVEERPREIVVRARVHPMRLDMFLRIISPSLVEVEDRGDSDGTAALNSTDDVNSTDDADRPDASEGDRKDGEGGRWATVRLAFDVLPAVNQLLQFGTWVEVVEPPEARAELARRAAQVCALYTAEPAETPQAPPPLAT